MGDSQHPKPRAFQFEVPDLELEPVPRSRRASTELSPPKAPQRENQARSLFDDEAFGTDGPGIDLALDTDPCGGVHVGGVLDFDAARELDLETSARSGLTIDTGTAPPTLAQATPEQIVPKAAPGAVAQIASPACASLPIDALVLSRFANYGDPPKSVYLTPFYAYRVFRRQREIKRALVGLENERQRADSERDDALAELGRSVRSEVEQSEALRHLIAPLVELEQAQSQRGQALSIVRAELAARASTVDAELLGIAERVATERARERDAQQRHEEQQIRTQRAEAKIERAQIEIQAVRQLVEQKLGPAGGMIPEPEAAQLAALKERVAALEPEAERAKAELTHALHELERATARVDSAQRDERLGSHKKQVLLRELDGHAEQANDGQQRQHAALADLGRAALAAQSSLPAPPAYVDRAQGATQRAAALSAECALHAQAAVAFDDVQVAHGVRLACTFAALFVCLVVLKLVL